MAALFIDAARHRDAGRRRHDRSTKLTPHALTSPPVMRGGRLTIMRNDDDIDVVCFSGEGLGSPEVFRLPSRRFRGAGVFVWRYVTGNMMACSADGAEDFAIAGYGCFSML